MTERGLLPFAPPPYRSEALYSWLKRLARPYGLEPWQLLHELGVGPFAERHARYRHPVQSNLDLQELRHLARLTRIDPSRLGLDRLCPPEWTLVSDEWCIGCPECERDDQRRGMSSFERAAWRSAACTLCLRHGTSLVQMIPAARENSDERPSITPLTTLEKAVCAHIFALERDTGCALRGIAPARAGGTLTAREFLMVLQDLLTFAVERWGTPENVPRARSISTRCTCDHWRRRCLITSIIERPLPDPVPTDGCNYAISPVRRREGPRCGSFSK